MDQSVKTLVNLVVIFVGMMLLLSCVSFFIVSAKARTTLYSVIENIEIYGYDAAVVNNTAQNTKTQIEVNLIESTSQGSRYQVQVSFDHVFSFIQFKKQITYTATTRLVSY